MATSSTADQVGSGTRAAARRLLLSTLGAAILLVAGLLLALAMGAPRHDALLLALLLGVSGIGSLFLANLAIRASEQSHRFGLARRLLIPAALAIVVMLLNAWFTASLMFINEHDVAVLALLLGYAGVLAMLAASALARSITHGLSRLTAAVTRMANGESGVRVPVDGADEVGALGAAFNRMAQEIEAAARQRQEMEEARRALLVAVSHDLRTPLSAIKAMVEAIDDGVVEDAQTVERYHRTILGEIDRLSALINDLFDLTRIEAGARPQLSDRIDPAELVSETIDALQAEAGRANVALTTQIAPDVPEVMGDPTMLHRVVLNLLTNALRHTSAGGSVTASIERAGDDVRISVCDTGEGIDPADLPHVFERFYRADKSRSRAGGGTGLGLAIVRAIVELHGGSIGATSTPGAGSVFSFTLPIARGRGVDVR